MYNGADDLPAEHTKFERVSTRTISLNIDWRKGLHDHWPTLFDYFHMAAVGVTVHASLYEICPNMYKPPSTVLSEKKLQPNKTVWPFQQTTPAPYGYRELLFGEHLSANASSKATENAYVVPAKLIERAKHTHKMLADVVVNARDNLRTGFIQMTGEVNRSPALSAGLSGNILSVEEVETECSGAPGGLGNTAASNVGMVLPLCGCPSQYDHSPGSQEPFQETGTPFENFYLSF